MLCYKCSTGKDIHFSRRGIMIYISNLLKIVQNAEFNAGCPVSPVDRTIGGRF